MGRFHVFVSTVCEVVAIVMLSVGIVMALAHLLVVAASMARGAPTSKRPDLVPWGYLRVGLVVAFAGFYLGRSLSTGSWGDIQMPRVWCSSLLLQPVAMAPHTNGLNCTPRSCADVLGSRPSESQL